MTVSKFGSTFVASTMLLASCASGNLLGGSNDKKDALPRSASPERVLLLKRCPASNPERKAEAFGAVIVPLLIALGNVVGPVVVGSVVDVIKQFVDERNRSLIASSHAFAEKPLYAREPKPSGDEIKFNYQCIVFVRGEFGSPEEGISYAPLTRELFSYLARGPKDESIVLKKKPELYIEFSLQFYDIEGKRIDQRSISALVDRVEVVPTYLYYSKSGARRNLENFKQISANIIVEDLSKGESKSVLGHLFNFGKVKIDAGIAYDRSQLLGKLGVSRSKSFKIPPPFREKINRIPLGARLSKGRAKYIVNLVRTRVTVTVTEDEKGGDLERVSQLLSKALGDNRDALTKASASGLKTLIEKYLKEEKKQ